MVILSLPPFIDIYTLLAILLLLFENRLSWNSVVEKGGQFEPRRSSRSPCLLCRGTKMLCGKARCPGTFPRTSGTSSK